MFKLLNISYNKKMIQEKNFSIMCNEVLEVLKYCPKSDIEKIPKKLLKLLNENKDGNHNVKINPNKPIFEQPIIEETIIMMFIIFRNYWASQEEKEEIDNILKESEIKFKDFYAYDKMFNKNKSKDNNKKYSEAKEEASQQNNTALIEHKESFIKKIIKIIQNFFKE